MTKEKYFEMCEMLNTPIEEENIPYELEDLPIEVIQAIDVYSLLQDNYDPIGGRYLGKNLQSISEIFNILEVDDKILMLRLIRIFDNIRSELINKKEPTSKN